jgi:hypothetical protein
MVGWLRFAGFSVNNNFAGSIAVQLVIVPHTVDVLSPMKHLG